MSMLERVERLVRQTPVTDIHTHIYAPVFGDLLLWGVDELMCYHYLSAETMRYLDIPFEAFYAKSKREQADLAFEWLFIKNSPYSEACRGVLTALRDLGMDVASRDLDAWRSFYEDHTSATIVDRVFSTANVRDVIMTNDPFDDAERAVWMAGAKVDKRFHAALRLDGLLVSYKQNVEKLRGMGYAVDERLTQAAVEECKRFLRDWCARINPVYMAVSLPDTFVWPDDSIASRLISEAVLPVCRELNLPMALMIGVKRLINPGLRLAGDGVGAADVGSVERLCAAFPHNKFLVTMLSRENQHTLCVAARKFRNLHVFGCWWFLNNPSLIEEMTRMRMELLGASFTPQHSDARVLDQLVYKWSHSRTIIARVLADKYEDLEKTGWRVSEDEMRRDVEQLLGGAFWDFTRRTF
nr:glucuronate isomerase [bacterium]